MGKLFTISPKIRKIAQDGIDDLIDQLGKDCLLVYPSVQEDCPNCVFDPTTGRSSGVYKTGGPRPFPRGSICPVCRGKGTIDSDHTDVIRLLCTWNPKQFVMLAGNIERPYSVLQTKGYMTDVPKIIQARRLIVQLPIEPYVRATFELMSEPIDPGNIIQGRYFIALWKQIK